MARKHSTTLFSLLLVSGLAFTGAPAFAACPSDAVSAQPDWVRGVFTDKDTVSAVGVANGESQDYQSLAQASLAAAKKALAESIVTNVSSETTIEQEKRGTQVEEVFRSVTRLQSSVQLNGVAAEARWMDSDSCNLYTLVSITRAESDSMASDAFLSSVVEQAADRALSFDQREANYEQALRVVERARQKGLTDADLDAVPLLESVGKTVARARAAQQETQSQIDELDRQLQSTSRAEQRAAYRRLLDVVSQTRFDAEIDTAAEPLYAFAARVEQGRGELCGARRFAADLERFTAFDYWKSQARNILESLADQREDCPLQLRDLLGGTSVELVCQYRSNGQVVQWDRLCAELAQELRKTRAAIEQTAPDTARFDALLGGTSAPAAAHNRLVVAAADGAIEIREGRGSTEYRFNGRITLRISDSSETLWEDVFSGTTGWNPLSENMVMDILAINVAKRMDKKLGE